MKHLTYNAKKKKFIILLLSILLFSLYFYKFMDNNIKPTLVAIGEVKARTVTTEAINDTIKSKIKYGINYNDLIYVKYDNQGRVTLMQANTVLMNSIASDLALDVQEQLKNMSTTKVGVPLSNIFNNQLIQLPSIKLKIKPQGSVSIDFATQFEESGINQTRHRIYLIVNTDIKMIIPLVSENLRITTNVPIAETIIVGNVPEQYISLPKDELIHIIR